MVSNINQGIQSWSFYLHPCYNRPYHKNNSHWKRGKLSEKHSVGIDVKNNSVKMSKYKQIISGKFEFWRIEYGNLMKSSNRELYKNCTWTFTWRCHKNHINFLPFRLRGNYNVWSGKSLFNKCLFDFKVILNTSGINT